MGQVALRGKPGGRPLWGLAAGMVLLGALQIYGVPISHKSVHGQFASGVDEPPHTYLVTFDGNKGTTFKFVTENDPVMGGLSRATFNVTPAEAIGSFVGAVVNVPSLQAPGFCWVRTDGLGLVKEFNDASQYTHMQLLVRSSIPYRGFKLSFAADTLDPQFKSFKADFNVSSDGTWQLVSIPFEAFSNDWDPATGEPRSRCLTNKAVCPSAKNLRSIAQIGIWAEGVGGKFDLDVHFIRAGNITGADDSFDSTCTGAVQKNLRYNISLQTSEDLPFPVSAGESLADAVCCDKRFAPYAEPRGLFATPPVNLFSRMSKHGETTFYDSVCGIPLFVAPRNRSLADFQADTTEHGWPSFRPAEIVKGNSKIIASSGYVVSKCGTHLGSYLPDERGPRWCLDLSCLSGNPVHS